MFGKDFSRKQDNEINYALNYGYAIVRAYICRTIAKYGYEPSIGIHHCSQLNNFNLADDLIEPFRPIVDLYVYKKCCGTPFDKSSRMGIANILNYEMIYNGQKHSVAYAIELTVQSFGKKLAGEAENLVLPEIDGLKLHEYE